MVNLGHCFLELISMTNTRPPTYRLLSQKLKRKYQWDDGGTSCSAYDWKTLVDVQRHLSRGPRIALVPHFANHWQYLENHTEGRQRRRPVCRRIAVGTTTVVSLWTLGGNYYTMRITPEFPQRIWPMCKWWTLSDNQTVFCSSLMLVWLVSDKQGGTTWQIYIHFPRHGHWLVK